jgi:GAF domain-containing protein
MKLYLPPKLEEYGSYICSLFGSKSPVHIPDLATHLERNSAGEAEREAISKIGIRTTLIVPMLRNDELIGSLSLARWRIEPFTVNEIELLTDFAAQAAIALEITSPRAGAARAADEAGAHKPRRNNGGTQRLYHA